MSIQIKLPSDFTKIDVNELGEVIWWTNHLGVSPEELLSIVNKVGPSTAEVKEALASLPIKVFTGDAALEDVATWDTVDLVLGAIVGFAGLPSTLAAVNAGKTIALANKETLVVAGELVMKRAFEKRAYFTGSLLVMPFFGFVRCAPGLRNFCLVYRCPS